jgi:predicted nucleic acid-binding protein
MPVYFADTSFWIALVDRGDSFHEAAVELSGGLDGRITTTEAVLLETANSMARPDWRPRVIALIEHLRRRPDVEVLAWTADLWHQGWLLFCNRAGKAWSLTDCMSFEVMRERGISAALTADSDFTQAGFQVLLSAKR